MEHSLLSEENAVEDELVETLDRLKEGGEVDLERFWSTVETVNADPELTDRLANLVGEVEGELFRRDHPLRVGVAAGSSVAVLSAVIGLLLVGTAIRPGQAALYLSRFPGGSLPDTSVLKGPLLLTGQVLLGSALHPLSHYLVGRGNDIRFSYYFLDGLTGIGPAVKPDYSSYLRAAPRGRARMHISGPAITCLTGATVLSVGLYVGASTWSVVGMALVLGLWILGSFGSAIFAGDKGFHSRERGFESTDTYKFLRERGRSGD